MTWVRILWPGFTKRSSEMARTNGPQTFLRNCLNMPWSVRLAFPPHLCQSACMQLFSQSSLSLSHPILHSCGLSTVWGAFGFIAGLHRPWSPALHWLHHPHVQNYLAHAVHTPQCAQAHWIKGVAGPRGRLGWDIQPRWDYYLTFVVFKQFSKTVLRFFVALLSFRCISGPLHPEHLSGITSGDRNLWEIPRSPG